MNASRAAIAAAGLLVLAGCASYDGRGLKPGTATAADVRHAMGEPATMCPLADGGQNWVYPRGPAGLETFDVRLDKDGILRDLRNVLDDAGFARVQAGKSNRNDILCLFGPPYLETYFKARRELVWEYRFQDAWRYPSRYYVLFNDGGIVTSAMQIREDYGDGRG
jgi:hypothetical protein